MQQDGLTNVLAQLGADGDKSAAGFYAPAVFDSQNLANCYATSWVAQRSVDIPVDDATRRWRQWDDEAALAIEGIEERIKLRETVAHAMKQARIYGGAVIFIGTDRSTLTAPLQPDEKIRFLNVFDSTAVSVSVQTTDRLTQPDAPDAYTINGRIIHASRLAIFPGAHCPTGAAFGRSVLASTYEAIRNADSVAANVAALVYEAKLDVYKIPDLLAQDESDLMTRLRLAQMGKSIVNAIVMDAAEDHQQKQLSFGGVKDILLSAYQLVAGATGIPASKLLGMPVSGLSATGENEIREYYDVVEGVQNNTIRPAIVNIDRLICHEAGIDYAAADYEWRSLWQQTEKERADTALVNAQAVAALAGTQALSDDQIQAAASALLGDIIEVEEPENVL